MRAHLLLLPLFLMACDDNDPVDLDGDGFAAADDCDDSDSAVNPDAEEVCDSIDNDCDGEVDNEAADAPTFYADADGDGYGEAGVAEAACAAPSGYVAESGDCDDSNAAAFPGGAEVCDGADNDCDGEADNEAADAVTFYGDADGDGYGEADVTAEACSLPAGHAEVSGDCDDANAAVNPGMNEICDLIDNDCDEATTGVGEAWFVDADGVPSDMTEEMSGTGASPAAVSLSEDGALYVCAGEWSASLSIGANVDVIGPQGAEETTISAGGDDSVVRIETDGLTASVSGLSLTDGVATSAPAGTERLGGGGLYCDAAATVSLSDVILSGHTAQSGAGAVIAGGCIVSAADSTFSGNIAADEGGGVSVLDGELWLEAVDMDTNSAKSGLGGAAHIGEAGILDVAGGTFSANSAVYGGAFHSAGELTISEAALDSNTASNHGGGIHLTAGSADISLSTFITNYAAVGGGAFSAADTATATVTDSDFSGDYSDTHAGAIDFYYGAHIAISGSSFTGHTTPAGGGAIEITESTMDLSDTTFDSCTAADGGSLRFADSVVTVADTVISSSTSTSSGGGIYAHDSTMDLSGVTVEDSAAELGGGLFMRGSVGDASDLTLSGNSAAYGGGMLLYENDTLSLEDSLIEDNTATDAGGGMFLYVNAQATGDNVDFSNNSPEDMYSFESEGQSFGTGASFSCTEDGC